MSTILCIPVNLRNPGEFLACCGFLEGAHRLWMGSDGFFGSDGFLLRIPMAGATVKLITESLCGADATAEPLSGVIYGSNRKPVDDPNKILPLRINGQFRVRLSWWLEEERSRQSPFKMWSAHGTSLSIFSALRGETMELQDRIDYSRPFACKIASSTRFGLDPGAGWNSLDAGFSPNEQRMRTLSSPVLELFAALGLQRFRPVPIADDDDAFRYSIWRVPLNPVVAAAAATGAIPGGTGGTYRFRIVSRGKFGCFSTANQS
jgi:CRISPR-associated protein Csx14